MARCTVWVGLVLGASLLLAACGSSSGGGTAPTTVSATLPFGRPACDNGALNSTTVTACYAQGQNWNDYVKTATPGTPCEGTETGGYYACLHGGEYRAIQVPALANCQGATADDALGALLWACDASGATVRIVSVGLRPGKYLSDLIDFDTTAFKANSLTVTQGGSTVFSTTSAVWWGNSVVLESTTSSNLADLTGTALTNAIYIVTAANNADYQFSGDRLALVVKPGITTVTGAYNSAIVEAAARKFLWIEGSFSGEGYADGVALNSVSFSVLRGVRSQDGGSFGVQLQNSSNNNLLVDIVASTPDFSAVGVELVSSLANTLLGIMVASNETGLRLGYDSQYNRLIGITAGNNGAFDTGLVFIAASDNLALGVTAANTTSDGVALLYDADYGRSDRNVLVSVAAMNNGGIFGESYGLHIDQSYDATVLNLAAANNEEYGVLLNLSESNVFAGLLLLGTNGLGDCSVTGGTSPGLADGTCDTGGTATLTTGINAAVSFVGQVTTDDAVNPDDTDGFATNGTISDWTQFQNPYRGWGRNGPGAFDFDDRGWYTPDGWRIWDWSLRSTDSVLRNVVTALPTGNDTLTHTWDVPGAGDDAACDAQVPGSTWTGFTDECQSTFLRNAVEIVGDAIGNENGLCESGEYCLFTPNIGSYQGHGNLELAGTIGTGGTLSNITLLKFATNGY